MSWSRHVKECDEDRLRLRKLRDEQYLLILNTPKSYQIVEFAWMPIRCPLTLRVFWLRRVAKTFRSFPGYCHATHSYMRVYRLEKVKAE